MAPLVRNCWDPCDAGNHEPGRGNAYEDNTAIPSVNASKSGPTTIVRAYIDRTMQETLLRHEAETSAAPCGEATFATAAERDLACARLERAGMVVVELEGIGPSARGRLAEVVDEAIERALCARSAAGPGITSGSDRDATLSDQLFRARRTGAAGLAVVLGPLRAAAGFRSALGPEDVATLRFLADATRERPIALILDRRDATTGAFGDPVALRSLLEPPAPEEASAVAPAPEPAPAPALAPAPAPAPAPALALAPALAPPARHTAGAVVVLKEETWRAWTLQLTAARGAQPLAVLERLFAESYMPLANAIAQGLDDPRARHARDEFATTFSKGYADGFATFAASTRRPRMVLDAHDVAARIGRLHGARGTRVLLVDAMRWDVARMVEEHVVAKLGSRASLTDELMLWSALPTTTLRQLETIARGVEALRAPSNLDEDASGHQEPPRGRTAEYVRRMRVGPREIHRLDLIEARVQAAGGAVVAELPGAAEAAAEAITRHVETCPPRTLLLITGDHGFTIDRDGSARQGGASPEEVLVGAFALLVGETH